MERTGSFSSAAGFGNPQGDLPGDHWVSNVDSRKAFLQTLDDTLGFTPKVDFNAGVVAAGEAQLNPQPQAMTKRSVDKYRRNPEESSTSVPSY